MHHKNAYGTYNAIVPQTHPTNWTFENDQPLAATNDETVADQDRFRRLPYAQQLIRSLQQVSFASVVVGLEGSWGSGKSSVLALMREELERQQPQDQPTILDFNPWWYTGRDDLVRQFFIALERAISPPSDHKPVRGAIAALGQRIGKQAKGIGAFFTVLKGKETGEAIERMVEALGAGGSLLELDAETLHERKEKAEQELEQLGTSIWVLLDDIDRLLPEEALEVLTMVRGIGNLPNIRYILAYDRTQLERRIASAIDGNESDAREYINKIVQLSFPIPDPLAADLGESLQAALNDYLGPDSLMRDEDFWSITPALGVLIRTARDVKRLVNAFAITRGLVGQELNYGNLLLLELLRLEFPRLYEALPRHKHALVGTKQSDDAERGKIVNRLIECTVPEDMRMLIVELLCALFPLLNGKFPDVAKRGSTMASEALWSRSRLVTSQALFDAFFQRGINDTTVRVEEILTVETALDGGDVKALKTFFNRLSSTPVQGDTETRAALVLRYTNGLIISRFSQQRAKTVIELLLAEGDRYGDAGEVDTTHLLGGMVAAHASGEFNPVGQHELLEWTLELMLTVQAPVTAACAALNLVKALNQLESTVVDRFKKRLKSKIKRYLTKNLYSAPQTRNLLDTWAWLVGDADPLAAYGKATRIVNKSLRTAVSKLLKNHPETAVLLTAYGRVHFNTLKSFDLDKLQGINPRVVERYFDTKSLEQAAIQSAALDQTRKAFIDRYLEILQTI